MLRISRPGLALLICTLPALADEGLWPYNQFPPPALKDKHDFQPPTGFIDHLRASSVRIGNGSGAFVSPTGLLLTNRQMAATCLDEEAFSAATIAAEKPCPGLTAQVLLKIDDFTLQIRPGSSVPQRNAAIAAIEKSCAARAPLDCSVVRLFAGGRYDLYQYKRYSDLRLVFAPEYALAFFGKERDSITYLRYGMNVAFLRAYENGKPASTPDFLKWADHGVREGDLVFTAANPGPTSRAATAAQLTFYRDTALPITVTRLQVRLQQLSSFLGQPTLTTLLNSYKSAVGKLIGLRDDRLVTRKTNFDLKIRRAVEADSKMGTEAAKVWDEVATAYKKWTPFEKQYQILEGDPAPGSALFARARAKLRGEAPRDAAPVNNQIEALMLTSYLEELKQLGDKEAPVKAVLASQTPKQAADAILADPKGIDKLAAQIEPAAQKLRKQREEIIGNVEVSAAEKVAQYRMRLFGAAEYPDGTGTPRIEYGTVTGYTDRAAVAQPYASTFSGLYYRQSNDGPWQVPANWLEARPTLTPVTPLDFVSTCDTGGGDYGSPVVNRAGELVGVTFDGNLESLPNTFLYVSDQARAVHVDIRGISEALRKVYRASALLQELGQ